MDDLTLKLKQEIVKKLTANEQTINDVYIATNNREYTRNELADEINNETDFGIKFMSNMLQLAIDLTSRQKY
jgi:ribose 5-phosphate isomerase RpiB